MGRLLNAVSIQATSLIAAFAVFLVSTASAQRYETDWIQRYSLPGTSGDNARLVAVDSSGNVFVAGASSGATFVPDFAVLKYSSTGIPLWTNRYDGSGNQDDAPYGLVLDHSGNVIVTGYSKAGLSANYATVKYSSAGVPLWTNTYPGPGNSTDWPRGIGVDSNDNVFVTGESVGVLTGYDYATIKYSSGGAPLWTNRYNGTGNDSATALAVDASGNVYVTGYSDGDGTDYDIFTIKYSGNRATLWNSRFNGVGNGDDMGRAICLDVNGNVLVAGDVLNVGTSFDFAIIKYSAGGQPLWTNYYTSLGSNKDTAIAVATDQNANVIVTGYSASTNASPFNYDTVTIKYSGAGEALWTNRYSGASNVDDMPAALAVDASGDAFVTGSTGNDAVTIAYSSAGLPVWTNTFNGPANSYDGFADVAVDEDSLYVVGVSQEAATHRDFVTIKYSKKLPVLKIAWLNNRSVLSWTNSGFGLQSAPGAAGTFTNILGATSPYTNPITGAQQFFRLASP